MEILKKCLSCGLYTDRFCVGCKNGYSCRVDRKKSPENRIKDGCKFECTDNAWCKAREPVDDELEG